MNKVASLGVLTTSLLLLVLSSTSANAAGFVNRSIKCPVNNKELIAGDKTINIKDIIISTNKTTDVTLKFNPPKVILMTVFIKGQETFVANFKGQFENVEKEQALQIACGQTAGQTATVSVTIVGSTAF